MKKVSSELSYYHPLISDDRFVYSVDSVRLSFSISPLDVDIFCRFLTQNDPDFNLYISDRAFHYRYLLSIAYSPKDSCSIGFSLNASDSQRYDGFMDFNPNKVCQYDKFLSDFRFIFSCFKHCSLKRCDIAIDFEVDRSEVFLKKDERKYTLILNSKSDKTEYLGQRSHIGFVKLYNKQLESGLSFPYTRLEITCDSPQSFVKSFPKCYTYFSHNESLDFYSLSDTYRYIINAEYDLLSLNLDPALHRIKSSGRRTYEVCSPYIEYSDSIIPYDIECVNNLFAFINNSFLRK